MRDLGHPPVGLRPCRVDMVDEAMPLASVTEQLVTFATHVVRDLGLGGILVEGSPPLPRLRGGHGDSSRSCLPRLPQPPRRSPGG